MKLNISYDVLQEINMCAMSIILGVKLKVAYDILRLLRRLVPRGVALVSMEDLIFFTIAGLLSFKTIYMGNSGVVRAFAIAFIFIGAWAYDMVLGKTIFGMVNIVIKKYKESVAKVLKKVRKRVNILVEKIITKVRLPEKNKDLMCNEEEFEKKQ